MTDLFWPGDERAEDLFTPRAFGVAMVAVEGAWLGALVDSGIARLDAEEARLSRVRPDYLDEVAAQAESSGNPVVPLVALLRSGAPPAAAAWIHRGLTSQDVLDTALMLSARTAALRLRAELGEQIDSLSTLADQHRASVMAGRTLTQHAVPVTFGLKAAQWLTGTLDAYEAVVALRFPAQFGGAAGTLAAAVELAREAGHRDPVSTARHTARLAAEALGLDAAPPWQTTRGPVTRIGDALVAVTDAAGRIANDVLQLSRPEVAELAEPAGRGGSSTMPQKANPVLSVLVRRAALTTPGLAAQLHLAAAESVDERADGAWHTEWATLAGLARRSVVAASQTSELLAGLHVDTGRMAATARQAASGLLAEQRSMNPAAADRASGVIGYLGATDAIVDDVLDRARQVHQ